MADQGSGGLLSPFLRSRRIAAARPFLKGRLLDLGCGCGKLAGIVPPDSYLGVDIDEYSLDRARAAYPEHAFCSRLPPKDEAFDTVVALAFIEHVPDPAEALREMAARLRSRQKALSYALRRIPRLRNFTPGRDFSAGRRTRSMKLCWIAGAWRRSLRHQVCAL